MKIAIDCRFWGKSGIGTFIVNIVNELLGNHPEHNYLIIKTPDTWMNGQQNNVDFLDTDISSFSIREMIGFPLKKINECDVFLSPYINIPRGINVPIVSTIHDMLFFDKPELFSWHQRFLRELYIRNTYRRSKAILTVSRFSKDRISCYLGSKKPVYMIGNSLSCAIKNYQIKTESKEDTIVFVGNIKTHKGLKTLLQAYHEAKKEGYSSSLKIVGESEHFRTKDNALSVLLEETEDVTFTGYLTNEELYELVARACLLVLPSFYEGFGIPPMEALYLGTNVLISDIPVFREIYQDLPVTFFRVGDVIDLKNKLMADYPALDLARVRKDINQQYSIQGQVNLLLEDVMKVVAR